MIKKEEGKRKRNTKKGVQQRDRLLELSEEHHDVEHAICNLVVLTI